MRCPYCSEIPAATMLEDAPTSVPFPPKEYQCTPVYIPENIINSIKYDDFGGQCPPYE